MKKLFGDKLHFKKAFSKSEAKIARAHESKKPRKLFTHASEKKQEQKEEQEEFEEDEEENQEEQEQEEQEE